MIDIHPASRAEALSQDAIVTLASADLRITDANQAALALLGATHADLPLAMESWLAEDDWGLAQSYIPPLLQSARVWSGELRIMTAPSQATQLSVVIVPQLDQQTTAADARATMIVGSSQQSGAWAGAPDTLTGLPTRAVLIDRLSHALRRRERDGRRIATLFIDLDGLKLINDRYGHEVGDRTLVDAAERIRSSMRAGDTVARFGGDEFVVLSEALDDEDQARRMAERILQALRGANALGTIDASIGIAHAIASDRDPLALIGRADTAMYRAKARGGGRVEVFDREMQTRQEEDDELRGRLLDAITTESLAVAGQPIFELQTGRIAGVELFIRVRDQARALVSAADVLRLAREHSEGIDAAVIGRALGLVRTWRQALGAAAPRLHVNLSAQSLSSERFARRIDNAIAAGHADPRSIALEIDSTDIFHANEAQMATIAALRRSGFMIVVDGYGSGPISLRSLDAVQPAMVKIAGTERDAQALRPPVMLALLRATGSLGMITCVKGVETRDMLNAAVEGGAFMAQGNALSAVGPLDRVNEMLHKPPRLGF